MLSLFRRERGLAQKGGPATVHAEDEISALIKRLKGVEKRDAAGKTRKQREREVVAAVRKVGPIGRFRAG